MYLVSSFPQTMGLSVVCYAGPKLIVYVLERVGSVSKIGQLRDRVLLLFRGIMQRCVNERILFWASRVVYMVVENGWLSILLLAYLSPNGTVWIPGDSAGKTFIDFFIGCGIIEFIRGVLASVLSIAVVASMNKGGWIYPPYQALMKELKISTQETSQIDLARFSVIPKSLWEEPHFKRYTCCLTHRPARFPVKDPTVDGRAVVYEKAEILEYLRNNNNLSPESKKFLSPEALEEMPIAWDYIGQNLREDYQRMQEALL